MFGKPLVAFAQPAAYKHAHVELGFTELLHYALVMCRKGYCAKGANVEESDDEDWVEH